MPLHRHSLLLLFRAAANQGILGQVVSASKTDTFTTNALTYADITGLSVTITPTSASSRVLIVAMVNGSSATAVSFMRLLRGAGAIAVGDAASTRTRSTTADFYGQGLANGQTTNCIFWVDSPATISATTYKLQGYADGGARLAINRSTSDANNTNESRTPSFIAAIEVIG